VWQLQMLARFWVFMDSPVEYVSASPILASRVLIHNGGLLVVEICGSGRWCWGSFGDILVSGGLTRYLNPGF